MEKYKRIKKRFNQTNDEEIQSFFNELTKEGWQIVSYSEKDTIEPERINTSIITKTYLDIVVVCKKTEPQIL